MKAILNIKYADLCVQLLALLLPLLWAVITEDVSYFFLAYFTVGITQVISYLVNSAVVPKILLLKDRKSYRYTLAGIFIFTLVTGFLLLYIIGFILLFVFPVIVFWYLSITKREIRLIKMVIAEGIEFKKTPQ